MITPEPPSDTLTDDVVRDDVERTYTEAAQLHVRDRDVFYRFVGAIGGEDWLTGPTRQAHAARRHARALIASLDAVRQDEIGAHLESGAVPDTGQARADRLAAGIRRFADDCKLLLDFGGLDNRVARSIAQQERNLRALLAEPSGGTVQAPESPTDSTPKAGRGGSGEAETTTDTVQSREPVMTETTRKLARRVTQYRRESLGWLKQAIRADGEAGEANNALIRERQIAVLTKGDGHVDCAIEPAGDTVPAPDVAGPLVAVRVGPPGSGYLVGPFTPAEAVVWRKANVTVPGMQWAIVPLLPDAARPTAEALLGTDTTPDRLAWISEASETAAAERQARYQETACARRPAEERPDA